MSLGWPQLLTWALTFISAGAGAYLSTRLTFGRVISEKWWDKKYEAYSDVLGALHDMQKDIEADYGEELGYKKVSPEKQAELRASYKRGREKVERHRSIGSLVLGADAVSELKTFEASLSKASNEHTFFEHLDASYAAVNSTIDRITELGRKDLRSTKGFKYGKRAW